MYLSKTLSSDVIRTIGNGPVIERLRAYPQVLLKFVLQSSQSVSWCKQNKIYSTAIVIITDMTLSGVLPWNEVVKVIDVMFKFSSSIMLPECHSDFRLQKWGTESIFSRLFMMRHCPVLRDRWIKNPQESVCRYESFVPLIENPQDFHELYNIFLKGNFSRLSNYSVQALDGILNQCKAWGFQKGFYEIQRILNNSINDFETVLTGLAYARFLDLKLVESHCHKFLNELELTTAVRAGVLCFSNVSLVENDQPLNLTAADRKRITAEYISHKGETKYKDFNLRIIHLFRTRVDWLCVTTGLIPPPSFEAEGKSYLPEKVVKLRELKCDKLQFDGKSRLSDSACLGFIAFFTSIKSIDFLHFPPFNDDYFCEISKMNPAIEQMTLNKCIDPFTETASLHLASQFPNLRRLNLTWLKLSKTVFTNLLKVKQLDCLELSLSRFDLPDDLTPFSKITQLYLNGVKCLSEQDLARVWKAATKLKNLHLACLMNFKFSKFLNPGQIVVLGVHSDQLSSEPMALLPFTSLRELSIFGEVNQAVKSMLIDFKQPVRINFLGNFIG